MGLCRLGLWHPLSNFTVGPLLTARRVSHVGPNAVLRLDQGVEHPPTVLIVHLAETLLLHPLQRMLRHVPRTHRLGPARVDVLDHSRNPGHLRKPQPWDKPLCMQVNVECRIGIVDASDPGLFRVNVPPDEQGPFDMGILVAVRSRTVTPCRRHGCRGFGSDTAESADLSDTGDLPGPRYFVSLAKS